METPEIKNNLEIQSSPEQMEHVIDVHKVEEFIEAYQARLEKGRSAFQEKAREAFMHLPDSLKGQFTPAADALFQKFLRENHLNRDELLKNLALSA